MIDDEEFDSHLYIHNAPIPIGTKTMEIDYFNIAKDQLDRTVIKTSLKILFIARATEQTCLLIHYEYQATCLKHNSMKLEELAWVLLLLICRMVL
jgi:hypothetical protein